MYTIYGCIRVCVRKNYGRKQMWENDKYQSQGRVVVLVSSSQLFCAYKVFQNKKVGEGTEGSSDPRG